MRKRKRHSTPPKNRLMILVARYASDCVIWPIEDVNQIQLYSLGLAQNESEVELHWFDFSPKEIQVVFTGHRRQISQFTRRFTELLEVNLARHLGRSDSIFEAVTLNPAK